MKKIVRYVLVVPFVALLIAAAALYTLASCILDEIKRYHNGLVLYQQIDVFLAQERQKR